MANTISSSDKVIDSRDVIARIEELQAEREALAEAVTEAEADDLLAANAALTEWDEDNADELAALVALADEASGYAADWHHGEALISDDYFEEYAQQLAEDCGMVKADAGWPNHHIDWEAAADELKQDYTAVDFNGSTYWIR